MINPIKRLIVCCQTDPASVNICSFLKRSGNILNGSEIPMELLNENNLLMTISEKHLYQDNLDLIAKKQGFRPDVVIFPSVHASAAGRPQLTVHPIGNHNDAEYGGKERELVPQAPGLMSDSLREIQKRCKLPDYSVCFEVTHHGPWLETPTYFIEIGSDLAHWQDKDAGKLQADVLSVEPSENDYPTAIGIGGGHYAPRFTELALSMKINFGHMVPNYQMEGRNDEELCRIFSNQSMASKTKIAYIHKNSMKQSEATRIKSLCGSVGLEILDSKSLSPL